MSSWTIIDAYCGIGPWATRDKLLPATPQETLSIMDRCGIGRALVYGNLVQQWTAPADVNEYVARACSACERFLPAFVLAPLPWGQSPFPHPFAEMGTVPLVRSTRGTVPFFDTARKKGQSLADSLRRGGAMAAWVWPLSGRQGHGLWTWRMGDLYGLCSDCRLPLFLSVDGIPADLVHTICTEFPRLRLVLVGLDYRVDAWLMPLMERHAELFACLGPTYIPPLGPERFVGRFGAGRLVFGSGLPFYSPGGLVSYIAYSTIPDADKAAIFAGNLERLMAEVRL